MVASQSVKEKRLKTKGELLVFPLIPDAPSLEDGKLVGREELTPNEDGVVPDPNEGLVGACEPNRLNIAHRVLPIIVTGTAPFG